MNGLEIAGIIGAIGVILATFGGGIRWTVTKATEIWDKAMDKKDAEIKELRAVRDDALVQGVGEAKAAATAAHQEATATRELVEQLLTEWRGR